MTQGYEPIELTDDMPEPKDEGTYFLFSENISRYLMPIFHDGDYWELADTTCSWSELIGGRNKQERITIQSLAAHDARIRAEALRLTGAELDVAAHAAFDTRDDAYDLEDWEDADSDDRERYECYVRPAFEAVAKFRKEQKQ
jgi:hypothetical protein